jgi:hypothetical protein
MKLTPELPWTRRGRRSNGHRARRFSACGEMLLKLCEHVDIRGFAYFGIFFSKSYKNAPVTFGLTVRIFSRNNSTIAELFTKM